jgi:phospholipase C
MALQDIDHIVFVMLENRSFDHMLGYLSLDDPADPPRIDGLRSDKAWQSSFANLGDGTRYVVSRLKKKTEIKDPPHGSASVAAQMNAPTADGAHARMGGFVQAYIDSRVKAVDKKTGKPKPKPKPKPKRPGDVMGYYDSEALPAFDFFARNFCVCDRWFTPLPTGTQANRLMAMAGESTIVNNAKLLEFPEQSLVYDWLNQKKISWRVYTWGGFVPFFALHRRWRREIARSMLSGEGNFRRFSRLVKHWHDPKPFPSVVFIEPEYSDGPGFRPNDDHPPTGVAGGQALLGEIYNVLTSNPARWAKTLIIVTYDEHGGFFDHVEPLDIATTIGTTHLPTTGPRVPALLVSPHVAAGQVYKEDLDHTSFLQLLDERFGGGGGYSPAVVLRQASLAGRISRALRPPRTGAAAAPKHSPLEIKAFANSTHEWLAGGVSMRTPHTPNAAALDGAVRAMMDDFPALRSHSDTGEMTLYVETKPPPRPEAIDFIDDA